MIKNYIKFNESMEDEKSIIRKGDTVYITNSEFDVFDVAVLVTDPPYYSKIIKRNSDPRFRVIIKDSINEIFRSTLISCGNGVNVKNNEYWLINKNMIEDEEYDKNSVNEKSMKLAVYVSFEPLEQEEKIKIKWYNRGKFEEEK